MVARRDTGPYRVGDEPVPGYQLIALLGHGEFGNAPHIIEVTPEKEVVWTYQDHETMKTVSNVQVLDVPGDALKGDIPH